MGDNTEKRPVGTEVLQPSNAYEAQYFRQDVVTIPELYRAMHSCQIWERRRRQNILEDLGHQATTQSESSER
jgi:hypothetical protein